MDMSLRCLTMPSSRFHYDIGSELQIFLNNAYLHDIIVITNTTSSQRFYAHKDILRARSKTLDELFRTREFALQESQSVNQITSFHIHSNAEVTELILRYIYTDKCQPDTLIVPELATCARDLQLNSLSNLLTRRYGVLANPISYSDDRCDDERQEYDSYNESANGEGESHNVSIDTLIPFNRNNFLDASRMEGKVMIAIGNYRFRRQSAVLLSARSKLFASRIHSTQCTVVINDVSPQHINLALRFIRTENIDTFQDFDTALNVFNAVGPWGLHVASLYAFTEHVLSTAFINEQNIIRLWNTTSSSEYLHEQCLKFVQDRFMLISSRDDFVDLRHELLSSALRAGRINARSAPMIESLIKWSLANCEKQATEDSPTYESDIQQSVEQMILSFLPPNTMFNLLNRMNLLESEKPASSYIETLQ